MESGRSGINEWVRALPRRLSRSRRTPLDADLALSDRRGGSPRVTELGPDAWLVRRRTPAGRSIAVREVDADTWLLRRRGAGRVLRPIGPRKLRAGLLIDPWDETRPVGAWDALSAAGAPGQPLLTTSPA